MIIISPDTAARLVIIAGLALIVVVAIIQSRKPFIVEEPEVHGDVVWNPPLDYSRINPRSARVRDIEPRGL